MTSTDLPLALPLVVAPMAGGPTSPALVAAVCAEGGTGFLPGGYLTAEALGQKLDELDALLASSGHSEAPHGVNLFVPAPADRARDEQAVTDYAAALGEGAGEPRWDDDDHYAAKLSLLVERPVRMVSFTFGCPSADDVARLKAVGSRVLVTVTDHDEAVAAKDAGADALVVQGFDAGGHRSTHDVAKQPNRRDALALLPELADLEMPMIGAGGVATRGDVQRLLAAGAIAVAVGTAFLRCPEADTSQTHRRMLLAGRATRITRAFSGRPARGIVNDFMEAHEDAPAVYPQVDQVTKPLRAAAAARDDGQAISAWAGTGWAAAQDLPAAEVFAALLP